jgi:hypothetical protein
MEDSSESVVATVTAPMPTQAPMVKGPEGVPVHLLWDDVPPIQATGQKTRKKKGGWGHAFTADAGTSAEDRGVAEITISQLPGFQAPAATPAASAMVHDDDDDDDDSVAKTRTGLPRRNRRILAPEDDE